MIPPLAVFRGQQKLVSTTFVLRCRAPNGQPNIICIEKWGAT